MSGPFLLVELGDERYALAVEDVLEVGSVGDPAPVPGAHGAVVGLLNIRGEILPLLDLGSLVGAGSARLGAAMVVVEQGGRRAALRVDGLSDVAPLEEGSVQDESGPLRASVVSGGSIVGVLDVQALLDAVGGGVSG